MKFYACVYKLKEEQLINSCIKLLNVQDYKIIDIATHKIEEYIVLDEDIIYTVAFGKIALNNINECIERKNLTNIHITKLPSPSQLIQSKYNQEHRKEAFEQLNKLKEKITTYVIRDKPVIIQSSDIEEVDRKQIAKVYKDITQNTQDVLFRFVKGSKIIEVSQELKEQESITSISINELFILSTIKDLFGVEKIEILRKDTSNGN